MSRIWVDYGYVSKTHILPKHDLGELLVDYGWIEGGLRVDYKEVPDVTQ